MSLPVLTPGDIMHRLLRWLFTGDAHTHKWDNYDKIPVNDSNGDEVAQLHVMKCVYCGDLKIVKITSKGQS